MDTWETLMHIAEIILAPAIGLIVWMMKNHSKRSDELDDRVTKLEIHNAVLQTQFKNIDKKLDEIHRCLDRLTRNK